MKKFLAILLALVMVFSLAACGGSDNSGDNAGGDDVASNDIAPLHVKAYNAVAGETVDGYLQAAADKIKEKSGGAIEVEIIAAGSLGAEKEASQLLQMGDIDIAPLSIDGVQFGIADCNFGWINLPYMLHNFDEVDEYFVNGWMFELMAEKAAANGIHLFAPTENGFKCLIGTGKAPQKYEDLAGRIVRTPDIDIFHYYYKEMGMITVSGIDQYTGLQQGTMDCITNSPWAMDVFSLEEVGDWMLMTNELYGTMFMTGNEEWLNSLDENQRAIIEESCIEACNEARQGMRDTIDAFVKKAEEKGLEIVYPDDEFQAKLAAVAKKTWDEFAQNFDKDAVDRLYADGFYPGE